MTARSLATEQPALWAAGSYLGLCLLLGGATDQGRPADALLALLALPLLAWAIWRLPELGPQRAPRLALAWFGLVLAWNLIQLVPLPPSWWTSLAGRAELAQELAAAGQPLAARPISLDRDASLRATMALLPPLALGLFVLGLSRHGRERLLQVLLILMIASLMLGLAQLAGGPDSPLRWHAYTNASEVVGPFANRNHLASLIVCGIPLAVALLALSAAPPQDPRAARRRPAKIALGVVALVLLLLGVAMVRSRAGVGLAALAVLAAALMLWRRRDPHAHRHAGLKRGLFATLVLGLVLATQFGFWRLAARFDADPLGDLRWTIGEISERAADQFGRLGVGAGGFVAAYQSAVQDHERTDALINRAHNDWREWRLEGGWPLMGVILLGLVLLAWRSIEAWRTPGPHALWQRAAAIGCWLVLLHSLADYPLRTTAIATVFALLVAHLAHGRRT